MQLKRFALFRDDVRDLVTLTVDRPLDQVETADFGGSKRSGEKKWSKRMVLRSFGSSIASLNFRS